MEAETTGNETAVSAVIDESKLESTPAGQINSLSFVVSEDPEDDGEDSVQLVPSDEDEIFVLARTPQEMATSQAALIQWSERRLKGLRKELKIAEENLGEARNLKIRTSGWQSQVRRWKKRILYYTKIKTALELGFFIVPDFPIDIIAVRTKKVCPTDQYAKDYESSIKDEPAQELAEGEGEFKSPTVLVDHFTEERRNNNGEVVLDKSTGNAIRDNKFQAAGALQQVDFPFRAVRPRILKDLDKALKGKLFDEIGVLPARRRSSPDPMLIGRIRIKEGYTTKTLSFLISWWIPTQSL